MQKGALRQTSTPLIFAAAIAAIISAMLVVRVPVPLETAASPTVTRTATDPRIRSASAASISNVLLSADLRGAVRDYHTASGDQALSVREIRALVDQSCRVPQLLQMDGRDGPDWRRDRFLNELQRRCGGWAVPSMWVAESSSDIFVSERESTLSPAQALAELRAADDARSLRRSWWNAYRLDALPQAQIFADQRRLLPAEARQLVEVVIDWRQCARFDACGSDSLLTLRVCAMHGCVGDEDLLGAWHAALSPRDFESALAISRWLPLWSADE